MSTTENAIIQSLVNHGIISDPTVRKVALDYVAMVQGCISNFHQREDGVVHACAWLAVEQYVAPHPRRFASEYHGQSRQLPRRRTTGNSDPRNMEAPRVHGVVD